MAAAVHHFGIRHHGPGSARRLLAALEELRPAHVLVEGPSDLSDLLPLLADPAMVPPVALLAYAADRPGAASFWPFAEFSPEYQAIRWALANDVPVDLIDLPAALRFADPAEGDEGDDPGKGAAADDAAPPPTPLQQRLQADPIGVLAQAAGYEDGESWWNDVIEEGGGDAAAFAAVHDAMANLREDLPPTGIEARREAHMRLAIADAAKAAGGPVAVVCGAWHVPALVAEVPQAADRETLRGPKRVKVNVTWTPWTSPRLARQSGYGAGVATPAWYAHLWRHGPEGAARRWVGRIAAALRARGDDVSTAALIETARLAAGLAAVRGRPAAGFEELRDAAVAALCHGEALRWRQIEPELLLGDEVGRVPPGAPLAPLLDDLDRQQRRVRLQPEALERELSLDLRSDSGLARSTLLHRLRLLDVPWGRELNAGRSRGTFRERWVIAWQPEYAVRLVEHLVYGATIERAAAARTAERMAAESGLVQLVELVGGALTAQLDGAARAGTARLAEVAAQVDDCAALLEALPPLVDTLRYGTARALSMEALDELARRIALQAATTLTYAVRNLDDEAAAAMRRRIEAAHRALELAEFGEGGGERWRAALLDVARDAQAARPVAGLAARLAFAVGALDADDLYALLRRQLSPAVAAADAAGFFEGFFAGASDRLLYDRVLRDLVDEWLCALDGDGFPAYLPLLRRVFASLDRNQRRLLIERLTKESAGEASRALAPDAAEVWPAHLANILSIMRRGANR